MLLGPLYPIVISHAGRILPHWLLTGSVGWIAGFAQAGSAFVPLITGAIASKEGIEALQPLYVLVIRHELLPHSWCDLNACQDGGHDGSRAHTVAHHSEYSAQGGLANEAAVARYVAADSGSVNQYGIYSKTAMTLVDSESAVSL